MKTFWEIREGTGEKIECPQCEGKGCDHCDDKGYHMKEAMTPAQKAAHAKALADFKKRGGKVTKLPPGKAAGYHGKDDPGAGVSGMLDKPDSSKFKRGKKVRSMRAQTEETQNEGKYVGGPEHTWPQHIGANNSPEAKKIKAALTKAGHSFKDHSHLPANKKMNKHYISMKDKEGHAALMKLIKRVKK